MKILKETIVWSIVLVFSLTVYSFVFKTLWGWFAVTVFLLPPLTQLQAAGIAILISYAKASYKEDKSGKSLYDHVVEQIVVVIVYAVLYLTLGYIIHLIS